MKTHLSLLNNRQLLPLFVATCFGAFNDNFFKNALILTMTYTATAQTSSEPEQIAALAAGLFVLPYFLFSALAGQIADKLEKSQLIQRIKLAEVFLMISAAIGFLIDSTLLLFATLFLMGVQSVFFGPVKYAILPDHLKEQDLMAGNAWIEMGLILSILAGTLVGLIVLAPAGPLFVSAILIIFSCAGFLVSRKIPAGPARAPDLKVNWNLVSETLSILKTAKKRPQLFRAILGVSWFWFGGALFLTLFPAYALKTLGAREEVVTLFIGIFSFGVAVGALVCSRLLKGEITTRLVPYTLFAAAVFCIDLYFVATPEPMHDQSLTTLQAFVTTSANWRIMIDLLGFAIAFGVFMLPLSTMIQKLSLQQERARTLAANNIVNTFFVLLSSVFISGMNGIGFSIPGIFVSLGVGNVAIAITFFRFKARTE